MKPQATATSNTRASGSRNIAKLPPAVGLLLAGLAIGPHGIGLIPEKHPVAHFSAELGKLLLMFSAGLDVNLELFPKARNRALLFGLLTTMVPQLLGTSVALLFARV